MPLSDAHAGKLYPLVILEFPVSHWFNSLPIIKGINWELFLRKPTDIHCTVQGQLLYGLHRQPRLHLSSVQCQVSPLSEDWTHEPNKLLFAALTIASTCNLVISPSL